MRTAVLEHLQISLIHEVFNFIRISKLPVFSLKHVMSSKRIFIYFLYSSMFKSEFWFQSKIRIVGPLQIFCVRVFM